MCAALSHWLGGEEGGSGGVRKGGTSCKGRTQEVECEGLCNTELWAGFGGGYILNMPRARGRAVMLQHGNVMCRQMLCCGCPAAYGKMEASVANGLQLSQAVKPLGGSGVLC